MSQTKANVLSGGPDTDLELGDVIRIILRRKLIAISTFLIVFAASICYLSITTWRYRAEAQIQILKEDSSSSISDILSSAGGAGDALSVNLTLQTYVGVLRSESLALKVIHDLQLEDIEEYKTKPGLFASKIENAETTLPLAETRYRREAILRKFQKNLSVSVVSGTRLMTVTYSDTNPDLAKRILNSLLNDFVEYNSQVRFKTTELTAGWLSTQLESLKSQVDAAQKKAAELQESTGIFGEDNTHNIVLTRLEALNQQLINAEQNRIVKGAVLAVVKEGNPELISNLSTTVGQTIAPGSTNSLALIQTLRQQEATLNAQYADQNSKYGTNYPRVKELGDQLAAVRTSIENEKTRLIERAEGDYRIAETQESKVRTEYERQNKEANRVNDAASRYLLARKLATSQGDLYDHLKEKLAEAGVVEGLHSNDVNIVDVAHVSAAPASPNVKLTLGLGLAAGLVLGISLAFLRDSLDRSLYSPEDVEHITSLAMLGVIPLVVKGDLAIAPAKPVPDAMSGTKTSVLPGGTMGRVVLDHPDSSFAEAFRSLKTALLLSTPDRHLRVIMVTSPLPHEGKSTVAANLAAVLSQQDGKRVLLVDADLRRGTLTRALGFSNKTGLSTNIAQRSREPMAPILLPGGTALSFLPSGPRPPYPAEMLASESMRSLISFWRDQYDYIIFDTPPVLPVTDAVAFSQYTDSVLLVARSEMTSKQSFIRAVRLLSDVQAPFAGAVFNAMNVHSSEYAYYTGNYNYNKLYKYGYDRDNETVNK